MEVKIMSILRDEETLTSYLKAQKNIRKAYEQWEFRDEEAKVGGKGGNQWCWAYALRYRKRATEEIKESGRTFHNLAPSLCVCVQLIQTLHPETVWSCFIPFLPA